MNNLHKEYVLERYKEGLTSSGQGDKTFVENIKNPEFDFKKPVFKSFHGLKKFSELDESHPGSQIS